jgi:malate permease and related proteins
LIPAHPSPVYFAYDQRAAKKSGSVMSNIILLFLCMLIGITLRRYGRVPDNAHVAINGFIINVSLPALTLLQIHGIKLQSTLAYAVAMPWLLFTIAVLFFWSLSKLLQFTPATTERPHPGG